MGKGDPSVSICIVTRNRKDELLRALASCRAQTYGPLEIRVYDNGSTDGTEEAVREEYPEVHFSRSANDLGAAAQRNRGFAEAQGKYAFSLDDDAYYTDVRTIAQAVPLLEENPAMAVLAMPFVEPAARDTASWRPAGHEAKPEKPVPVRSFVACACAFRRDAVLRVGGYREFFRQWGEERDLAIRLMDKGYSILYAGLPAVVHQGSARRDRADMEYFGVRNTLLFDFLNVPQPRMPPRLLLDASRLFVHRLGPATLSKRLDYVLKGLAECWRRRDLRAPVGASTYRRYRALPPHGAAARVVELPPLAAP